VKSWRFESFLPLARTAYRNIEDALGVRLWREMRVRRMYADEGERALGAEASRRAALTEFIESVDESGWWIRGAARVDLETLLATSRKHWLATGRLRQEVAEIERERETHGLVIDCRGQAAASLPGCGGVPWEFSKGELLELTVEGLEPDVILNRRHWIVPVGPGVALAGATNEPGRTDQLATFSARSGIEKAVSEMLGEHRPFSTRAQRVGVRVNLPDKRPVVGRLPGQPRVGVVNALGAKGASWAPMLARQWSAHLLHGSGFDPEIDVRRFFLQR
jgi:glycine/D-amino acid oxidase-like deaminating enzyme